ncbi:MAG TPA: MoxR family ATPase [Sumerlaeia bacterium]|nr:MoxR family ATPase [Sumerlaeia bacterium]
MVVAQEIAEINARVAAESQFVEVLKSEIAKAVVGQTRTVERLLIGLLCEGHVLLEGVPGLAKTLLVKTLASAVQASFRRLQFTPDLLPADLIGTMIYQQERGTFTVKKGPIFANVVLADEINRSPAKVQSALLEAMQERQVTIGDATYPLPDPFLVLATQNPIEQEGTYPLPEAQVDRFMLKVKVDYPSKEQERAILDHVAGREPPRILPVVTLDQVLKARETVNAIYMDEKIKSYIVDLVFATRMPAEYGVPAQGLIDYGASPRCTIYLAQAARALAFLRHRGHVIPDDVKTIGPDVLRHRLILSYEAEAEEKTPEDIIGLLFDNVEVP